MTFFSILCVAGVAVVTGILYLCRAKKTHNVYAIPEHRPQYKKT